MNEPARAQDRCPYSRDFDHGFDGCPAFESTVVPMTDSRGGPLKPVVTCLHLGLGQGQTGHFYPRCTLGGPARIRERMPEPAARE